MSRRLTIAATLLLAGATALPAAAQSWGFGVERPFFGPPPVLYDDPYYDAPMLYEAPPQVYREVRPVIRRAAPGSRVFHMEAPEDVLEELENAGYRDLSPMARRGTLYKLSAVDPDGELVALEISIFTGEIERRTYLEARLQAPPPVAVAPRPRRVAAPRPPTPRPAREPTVAAAPHAAPKPAVAALPTAPAAPPAAAQASPQPAAAAPPPPPTAAPAPVPAAAGAPGSTLRGRLIPPPAAKPAEPPAEDRDPLVVY